MKPTRDTVLALLAGALSLGSCAGTPSATSPYTEKPSMNAVPTASRPSAPEVPPVEHQGIRYEQDRHDESAGDQPGGYLAAMDIQSGARLWRAKVYTVPGAAPGRPAMARYFRSMRLAPEGTALLIENEAGGVYRFDLATQASTQVSGPPETAAPAFPPAKPRPMPE